MQYNGLDFRGSPCGLGDMLKAIRQSDGNSVYILPRRAERFATLFDGVAPVLVADDPGTCVATFHNKPEDLESARRELQRYLKPVAMCINCNPAWKHLRETDVSKWSALARRLSEAGFTVLQYGWKDTITKIEGATIMADLPIRRLASHYEVIGRYVGIDTGDMHLAIDVGAKAWVARPPECSDYRYSDWERKSDKVRYFELSKVEKMYDSIVNG